MLAGTIQPASSVSVIKKKQSLLKEQTESNPNSLGETPRALNFDPQKMTTVEKSTDLNPFSPDITARCEAAHLSPLVSE